MLGFHIYMKTQGFVKGASGWYGGLAGGLHRKACGEWGYGGVLKDKWAM